MVRHSCCKRSGSFSKWSGMVLLVCLTLPQNVLGVSPTADEMAEAKQWAAARFDGQDGRPAEPCFSFAYDGKPSAELLKTNWCARRIGNADLNSHSACDSRVILLRGRRLPG